MTAFDNSFVNEVLDFLLRGQSLVPPATLYVGLTLTAPTATAYGTEVSATSYARVAVPSTLAAWSGTQAWGTTSRSSGTSGLVSNNGVIQFATPTASWTGSGQSIVGCELWSALTGGSRIAWGLMSAPITVTNNSIAPFFLPNALIFQIS